MKSRDITLLTKVHIIKAMVFPVVRYECECWTIRKAESRRTDVFELWCWRRLPKVPWTARKSNLKEMNILWKDCCWSANILATWHEELIHWKRTWCWEKLKAKGKGGGRGWDGWMASPTQWIQVWASSGRQWRTEEPGRLQSMGSQRVGHDLVTEQQQKQQILFQILFSNRLSQSTEQSCLCLDSRPLLVIYAVYSSAV